MVIAEEHVRSMIDHAHAGFPNEACGLLASKDGTVVRVYCLTNADASPVNYRMDPQEQLKAMLEIDDEGWDLGAIFHSHPRTRAYPSETDLALAFYPDTLYIIISLAREDEPDVRAYRITEGAVAEEPLETVPT